MEVSIFSTSLRPGILAWMIYFRVSIWDTFFGLATWPTAKSTWGKLEGIMCGCLQKASEIPSLNLEDLLSQGKIRISHHDLLFIFFPTSPIHGTPKWRDPVCLFTEAIRRRTRAAICREAWRAAELTSRSGVDPLAFPLAFPGFYPIYPVDPPHIQYIQAIHQYSHSQTGSWSRMFQNINHFCTFEKVGIPSSDILIPTSGECKKKNDMMICSRRQKSFGWCIAAIHIFLGDVNVPLKMC